MSISEKLQIIADNTQKVYDAGKQAEYDAFWDTFQNNGARTSYSYTFTSWRNDCYKPKYPITVRGSAVQMFYYTQIKDTLVDIDLTNCTGAYGLFYQAASLETIRKLIIPSTLNLGDTSVFKGCSSLKNINIEGTLCQSINLQDCPMLTRASIENIISHLCVTEPTEPTPDFLYGTVTLSLEAVDREFAEYDTDGEVLCVGSETADWSGLITEASRYWDIVLV